MSSHAARDWNSVVSAPPPVSKAPAALQQRPSLQLPPRQTTSSTPSVRCRYAKAEMLAMYMPTDRPPSDYQFSLPIVSNECQPPVSCEPPSAVEREILESGTWYMPGARPNPVSSSGLKPGRNFAGRPARTPFSRGRPSATDDTPPSSDYRPTRFSWRHDSSNGPGSSDADGSEHRRGSFAEKPSRSGIGRSDAALSWRRGENEEQATTERNDNDAVPCPERSGWRSPTVQSRRQSVAEPQAAPPSARKSFSLPPAPEPESKSPEEGLAQRMDHMQPISKDSWWYQDPSGTVRGPFSSEEMRDWYQQSYFQLTLPVRCHSDQPFTPLGALFLQGDPAFLDHVPMLMAAPVEPRRPPPPPAQPYLPVHHLQQHVLPQHLPMFQPQPPPYFPHSLVAPSHQDSMFRSPMPFSSTPLGPPVLDQPVEPWRSQQVPIPEVIQRTPWMPFATPAPIPAAPPTAVDDIRVEPNIPEPIVSILEPEPVSVPASSLMDIPQALPKQGPTGYVPVTIASCAEPELGEPSASDVLKIRPETSVGETVAKSSSDGVNVENVLAEVSNAASGASASSSPSMPNSIPPAAQVQHSGWVSPPIATASPVISLLEIQREEERAHAATQQSLKRVHEEVQYEADSQTLPEPISNATSPWGTAPSKPAPRSLLEIQKQEQIIQMSKVTQRAASSGGWAAKVSPMASSWGASPKPVALSMRRIQEEEHRVLFEKQQQKEPAPQQPSGWSAAVVGLAAARPASVVNQAVARPPASRSSVSTASNPQLQQPQTESDSDDESPFWSDSKSKSSKSDSSARNDFGGPVMSPEFREWCLAQLAELSSDCDVSLADFLLTLESSEAIREYIYQYLGRSSQVEAFATGFLQHKDFDDSKLVVQSSRSLSSNKIVNNDSQDLSKKKKNRRRRKKSEFP